jgi:putative ABC transport system substrate-binding protein
MTTPAALAASSTTKTIPIVFITSNDPVVLGLVASFNRPGGNVTGVAFLASELVAKQLELLHELVPGAIIGLLMNRADPNAESQLTSILSAARALSLQIVVENASDTSDFVPAFAALARQRTGALVVGSSAFFFNSRDQLVAMAARHALPAIYYDRAYPTSGGLMSYGASLNDVFRLAGIYVGRVLNGEKPADLPIVQSTKFELVINPKTAKALGLTIPQSILLRADEVIE